ncbi:hypothetical protein [Bacillus paramycoides]|uniref:hypothetical protein n=1 Tax=Bacillus paramycoides TaxID=2026194 RepID=UPI003D234CA9
MIYSHSEKKKIIHGGYDFLGDAADCTQLMTDLLDYIISKGMDIVTLSEGLNERENLIYIGDYGKGHFMLSKDGDIKSATLDKMPTVIKDKVGITMNTPITDFEIGGISVSSFLGGDNTGFPGHQAGTYLQIVRWPR